MHGGVAKENLEERERRWRVNKGCDNLKRHIENVNKFGVPAVVAINRFITDTDAEISEVMKAAESMGTRPSCARTGPTAARARRRSRTTSSSMADSGKAAFKPLYPDDMTLRDKVKTIATEIYRAADIACDASVETRFKELEADGLRPPAGLHGQDAVFVLDRSQQARRAHGPHRAGARAAAFGGRRVRRRHHGRDHDHAGPAASVPAADSIRINAEGQIEGLF